MRMAQVEGWALRVVEDVLAKRKTEDARIELKAAWPDPPDGARLIAGHLNASRGHSVLWLIGVDEKAAAIVDVISRQRPERKRVATQHGRSAIGGGMTETHLPVGSKRRLNC